MRGLNDVLPVSRLYGKQKKTKLHVLLKIVTTDVINYITTNKTTKDKLSQEMLVTGCVLFLMVNGSFCP